ncbi:hypothetical protein [Candidatus Enterovibrio escicola]|uniref:Uncharacterized protein n=1 Tax=Candidatus Enterovibrio escicola TaxID=1927127 RepID=A0A2A5T6E1_9GAMM|nr:hypothetical protein [Candidatus Enterovibrio escacola]PCS23706.1 hypothetical protein BTN49_0675 [Candidatus Enterovibrio escacola]
MIAGIAISSDIWKTTFNDKANYGNFSIENSSSGDHVSHQL